MNKFLQYVDKLPKDSDRATIAEISRTLHGMNYYPTLLMETPGFLEFTKSKLKEEIGKIIALPDSAFPEVDNVVEFKHNHIKLLIYHYEQLQLLRKNDPVAWDIVNEKFEDD
ncbi:hypothetical protein ACFLQY_05655 [Verrucomicrobiota bacterium]